MSEKIELQNLADMIAYQEGSVVSRTLIKKQAGTVSVFAFDKDQGLSEHTAPFDAMVCILDGKADVTISGNVVSMSQGDMVIMPADEPHALKAVEKFKMMLTMIR